MFHEQITIFSLCVFLLIPKLCTSCLPSSSSSSLSTHTVPCAPHSFGGFACLYMCLRLCVCVWLFRRFSNSTFVASSFLFLSHSLRLDDIASWILLFTHSISHFRCVPPSFSAFYMNTLNWLEIARHFTNKDVNQMPGSNVKVIGQVINFLQIWWYFRFNWILCSIDTMSI